MVVVDFLLANEQQYKGKNSLLRLRCSCARCVAKDWLRSKMVCLIWWWLVLFIEAMVLFPNIEQEGMPQRPNLKGDN